MPRKKKLFKEYEEAQVPETPLPLVELRSESSWMDGFKFAEKKRERLERLGDWWYNHSYWLWVVAGLVWAVLTVAASFSAESKLVWLCGFIAFLHLYRGWEVYKTRKMIARALKHGEEVMAATQSRIDKVKETGVQDLKDVQDHIDRARNM
jgi:hypothetical protein